LLQKTFKIDEHKKKIPRGKEEVTQKRRGKRENPEKGKNGKNPKKERRKKTERRMNQCFFGNFHVVAIIHRKS
jgi:hypothetical protein